MPERPDDPRPSVPDVGSARWPTLETWLRGRDDGRQVLSALDRRQPELAAAHLQNVLRRADTPAPVTTSIEGGQFDSLFTFGQARDVHLDAGPRERPQALPAELPPDVAAFTGREAEVGQILANEEATDAHGPRAILLHGAPGIGKSALAIRAAHRLSTRYPDGQLYVNLQETTPGGLAPLRTSEVLGRFLRALNVSPGAIPSTVGGAVAAFRTLVTGRRLLIVLDNAHDGAQIRDLLPSARTCGVLITSRSMLTELDGLHRIGLNVLSTAESTALLGLLAGDARVAAEPTAAIEITRLCGRLPLALRIVGARLAAQPTWSLRTFARRLASACHRLDEISHADLAVRASFEVSYRTLRAGPTPTDTDGRHAARAFRLLGLVPGPDFTVDVVAVLLGQSHQIAEAALERLVNAQLVETLGQNRFRLHDLLLLYARELATRDEPRADVEAARRRVLSDYLDKARAANNLLKPTQMRGDGNLALFARRDRAVAWLDAERRNLVACVLQAATQGPRRFTWQLAHALSRYFEWRRYITDWRDVTEAALVAARAPARHYAYAEAIALRDLGIIHRQRREWDEVIERFRESLAICEEIGEELDEGKALNNLIRVYRRQRRLGEAERLLARSLALHRRIDDQYGLAEALSNQGAIHRQRQRTVDAERCLREALGIFRHIGARENEAITLSRIGDLYRHQDDFDTAKPYYHDALKIHQELGDRYREGVALNHLGQVLHALGHVDEAEEHLMTSLTIRREVGDRYGEANTLHRLGELRLATGRCDLALQSFTESLRLATEERLPQAQGVALHGLGEIHLDQGDTEQAIQHFSQAADLLRETEDPTGHTRSLMRLRVAVEQQERHGAAQCTWREARCSHQELNASGKLRTSAVRRGPDR